MRPTTCAALGLFAIAAASASASAADYQVVASGPIVSITSESDTFDGTSHGTLPPLLDINRLQGGSFRATFRFNQPPLQSGTEANYDLSPSSGMILHELLDSAGAVVHQGSNPLEPGAFVSNNTGSPPFSVDQVLLTSLVNDMSGAHFPAALYSASPIITAIGDLNFNGYVNDSVNYISDLSIPTNASTYMAFPNRTSISFVEFGDGDFINRANPYQYANVVLEYGVASVSVTPVPEPSVLLLPMLALLPRRRA